MNYKCLCICALVACALACALADSAGNESRPVRSRGGWLGRVVQYRRERFFADVRSILPPVQITARIERAPPGYVDASGWDFESASRLVALLRASRAARPVYRVLRRMLAPARRMMLSKRDSYKYFPSIHTGNYYDDSYEYSDDNEAVEESLGDPTDDERAIVIVSNPVEARLPSARISVKILREIMEARAMAFRIMPSTPATPVEWQPMNPKNKTESITTTEGSGGSSDSQNSTEGEKDLDPKDETAASTGGDATGTTNNAEVTTAQPEAE